MPVSKESLDLDTREKTPRQNQFRVLQSWKRLSEVKLNEENQGFQEQVDRLRRKLWELKKDLGEEEAHPFIVPGDVEEVEGELYE